MKKIILSHDSALAFWSNPFLEGCSTNPVRGTRTINVLAAAAGALDPELSAHIRNCPAFAHLPQPLDILCPHIGKHKKTSAFTVHTTTMPLPSNSIVRVPNLSGPTADVYVASPELCFLQMSQLVDRVELIELGFELCGAYAIAPLSQYGHVKRRPVTSQAKINKFLGIAEGSRGIKQARQAAKWILPDSASPKESQIAMLMTLSRSLGGMGLLQPLLNPKFELDREMSHVLGSSSCYPDFFWPEIDTVLEYDSKERHENWRQTERDSRKRNVYQLLGLNVITITKDQLYDLLLFRHLMSGMEEAFGMRRRPANEHQQLSQRKLHGFLLHGERRDRFTDPRLVF